jgi:hypothetical protein
MISAVHVSVGTALAASSLLGVAVRTGHVDLGARRWPHHSLYAASVITAASATLVDAGRGRSTWPAAASTLGVLAVLPATRGGSTAHVVVAVAATSVYVAGTIAASARRRRSGLVSPGW